MTVAGGIAVANGMETARKKFDSVPDTDPERVQKFGTSRIWPICKGFSPSSA